MNLLDTHALVWAIDQPALLSPTARQMIESEPFVVSAVSLWELTIKAEKSKGPVRDPIAWWDAHITGGAVPVLGIEIGHIRRLAALRPLHRDPFDRLLICQSIQEGFPLITQDRVIRRYEGIVNCIW